MMTLLSSSKLLISSSLTDSGGSVAFRELAIKTEYRSKIDDIPKSLVVPLLENSIYYKRAVGFFSSSALLEISRGIGSLAKRGGKIKLVASPNLSEQDLEAIESGYAAREIVRDALVRELPSAKSLSFEEMSRFNLLAHLIKEEVLDLRIALIDDSKGVGIYHEKMAIVEDELGDKVVFTGSMNESRTAMLNNYEAVDVFVSWKDAEGRIPLKEAAFDAIWAGIEVGVETYEFPEVADLIKKRYLVAEPNYDLDNQEGVSGHVSEKGPFGRPSVPSGSGFATRSYQEDAVEKWASCGYRGLFDMATGTGKTITGLLAVSRLYDDLQGDLAVIIACPYQHLVEQWVLDLGLFGIEPIIAYSKSKQKNWKKRLKEAVFDRRIGLPHARFLCVIATNATLASDWMQDTLSKLKGNVLLVADEAHNLGAAGMRKTLNSGYPYRLALSATFDRHHDDEGTSVLREYFGETCIYYPIEKAIAEKMLTGYRYYPIAVTLSDEEFDEYQRLTKELGKCMTKSGKGSMKLSPRGEIIAQQRARVVAAASAKLEALELSIAPYIEKQNILVYCGAAQLLSPEEDSTAFLDDDRRQITHVVDLLGNKLGMSVSKFTAEEDIDERETLKREFQAGNLQALIAIKCLDEGVNIPGIQTAFMLASTTNPKEYIQRRGRLLRLSEGKEYAEIFDFITLPYSAEEASGQTIEELKGVYSLLSNELDRGFEFAQHAMNYASAQEFLDELSDSFKVEEIKKMIELREQEGV